MHKKCIIKWNNYSCPLCRSHINFSYDEVLRVISYKDYIKYKLRSCCHYICLNKRQFYIIILLLVTLLILYVDCRITYEVFFES